MRSAWGVLREASAACAAAPRSGFRLTCKRCGRAGRRGAGGGVQGGSDAARQRRRHWWPASALILPRVNDAGCGILLRNHHIFQGASGVICNHQDVAAPTGSPFAPGTPPGITPLNAPTVSPHNTRVTANPRTATALMACPFRLRGDLLRTLQHVGALTNPAGLNDHGLRRSPPKFDSLTLPVSG